MIYYQTMKNKLKLVSNLLNDFLRFIDYRSIFFLTSDCLPKVLEWYFQIWKEEYKYLTKKDKLDKWSNYSEISRTLDSLLQKIEERAFKERESYLFFEIFEKHAEKHKKQFIESEDKSKKYYYVESLFSIFYRVFFEAIGRSPERHDVWEHYFPKEWKITKRNLEENMISRISLDSFLRWAQERIWKTEEKFDDKLDDVSSNLFPEVEPSIWARILIFVFSPYGEDRVKSVIERPWNFGFAGRIRIYSGLGEESEEEFEKRRNEMMRLQERAETEKTFELASLLFKQQFSKENLEKYLNEIKKLRYLEDSKEEHKRLLLLDVFEKMLRFLNQQQK